MSELTFRRQGRSLTAIAAVLGVWALLAAAWWFVNAALWILAIFALITLPALWDVIRNPVATLTLSDRGLHWQNRQQNIDLPLSRIARVRLDTRWDFSIRATIHLSDGSKLRLPQDCLPPHRAFEAALGQRGIATERHHFRVF